MLEGNASFLKAKLYSSQFRNHKAQSSFKLCIIQSLKNSLDTVTILSNNEAFRKQNSHYHSLTMRLGNDIKHNKRQS